MSFYDYQPKGYFHYLIDIKSASIIKEIKNDFPFDILTYDFSPSEVEKEKKNVEKGKPVNMAALNIIDVIQLEQAIYVFAEPMCNTGMGAGKRFSILVSKYSITGDLVWMKYVPKFQRNNGENYAMYGNYGVSSYGYRTLGNIEIKFEFNETPVEGIYHTTSSNLVNENVKNVYISVKIESLFYIVNSGGNVYLERIDNDTFKITFCDLTYSTNSLSLQGSLTSN